MTRLEAAQWCVEKGYGSVLLLTLDGASEAILARLVRVTEDNLTNVATLVARGASYFFHDPENRLDAAVRDKLICV